MTKEETNRVFKKIKAYYYYFDLDKDSIKLWIEKLLPYSFEDVDSRIEEHIIGEERNNVPKIQDLIRHLMTEEQKSESSDDYIVQCRLCHRWLPLTEYDEHYDRCLSISYLVSVAKQKGETFTRQDLENCREDILNKLYEKYKPENIEYKPQTF